MLETYKTAIKKQYEAAFSTMKRCITECSDEAWDSSVANLSFNQAIFHTLFYADFYLGRNDDSFQQQPFHVSNTEWFRDYEEFEDKVQQNQYSKAFINDYLDHCRAKMSADLDQATDESLSADSEFPWIPTSRTEVHVYNIRHIQHHAAQLILRLRLNAPLEFPWFKSGWEPNK